jgi:raffinose/stachyose/melibiose transport system substrate-binding protein
MKLSLSIAAISLAGLVATAAFAQTELRITHPMSGSNKPAFDAIVAEFEAANPDIKVTQIVFDDDQYSDTGLITQMKADQVPDIYFQWAGFAVGRDAAEGLAYDLTDALATDGWQDGFSAAAFSAGAGTMADGRAYMIPISFDITNTIWYNQAIFEENGLAPPANWAEFVALVKTLAEKGETPIVIGNNEFWPLGNWASHIASRVVPPEEYAAAFERTGKFDTPNWEKALGLIAELQVAGGFNKDIQGLGADAAMSTFFQEAAVMHPIGSWLISEAATQADADFRYAQFDTPMIDESHPLKDSVIGTFTGFMVHKNSPNPEAAIRFLKFFTSKPAAKIWTEAGNISPVLGADEGAALDEHAASIVALLAGAGSIVPPPDTTYPVPLAEAWYQAAAYVAAGEKSPKDALVWLDETVAAMAP